MEIVNVVNLTLGNYKRRVDVGMEEDSFLGILL